MGWVNKKWNVKNIEFLAWQFLLTVYSLIMNGFEFCTIKGFKEI